MAATPVPRRALRELIPRASPTANNFHNLALQDATPPSSPDEEFIRSRLRSYGHPAESLLTPPRTPPKFSPRKQPPPTPRSTPTKIVSPAKCPSTPTRSSLRKRLNLEPPSPHNLRSGGKKAKLELNFPPAPVSTGLSALSQHQLVELVNGLVTAHPDLEQAVSSMMPTPDLTHLEERLRYLRKNVYRSFPRKCWGSSQDSFCYTRVRTHLEAFKKECLESGLQLVQSQQWASALEYIEMAWDYALSLPDWEDPAHNAIKASCLRTLASHFLSVLKNSGVASRRPHLDMLENRIKEMISGSPMVQPCLKQIQMQLDRLKLAS